MSRLIAATSPLDLGYEHLPSCTQKSGTIATYGTVAVSKSTIKKRPAAPAYNTLIPLTLCNLRFNTLNSCLRFVMPFETATIHSTR